MRFVDRIPGDPDGYRPVAVPEGGADLACAELCALQGVVELCGGALCLPGYRPNCGHVYYVREEQNGHQ